MTEAAAPVTAAHPHRFHRYVILALVVIVMGAAASLLGWDISGWFSSLWDTMSTISLPYLIGGIALETLQTTAAAFAWYSILRYAYPGAVSFKAILACYATSVALNFILPANLGTLVMLFMFLAIIVGATFAGLLAAYAVEKIFFTLIGAFVYLYLFLSVGGSFDIKFAWVHEHPWATAIVIIGGIVLIAMLVRSYWPRVLVLWEKAKLGGQVLSHPRAYLLYVFLPSFVSWAAMLGMIAVFLAAYNIPVDFHTVMRVVGGNSIANVTSVTPGGAGVNQAFNVASLNGVTSATNATAYSVAQQLVTTAWSILYALVLLIWAFSWSGGRSLVTASYADAKQRATDEKVKRQEKKDAKKAARQA